MEKNNINESNVDRRLTSSHETKRSRPMFDTSRLVKDLNIIKNEISKGNENTTRNNDIDKLTPAKVYTSNNHVNYKPFEGSNRYDVNETRSNQNQPRTNLGRKTKTSNRVNDRNVECEENVTPPKRETANYNNRSNRYDEPIATHNQPRSNDRLAKLSNRNMPDKSHCNISQNNLCFTSQDVRFKNNRKEFKSDDLRSKLKHMEKHKDSQFNRIDFSKNTEDKVTHIPKKDEQIFDDLKFKHKNVGKVVNDLIVEKEIAKKIEIVGSFDNTKVIPALNKNEPIFGVLKFKSKYVEQINHTEVKLDSSKDTEFKKEQDKEVEILNLVNNKFDLVLKKDGTNDCSKAFPNVDVEKLSDINKDRTYHDKSKHTCDNKDYAPIFGVLKFKKKFVDSVNSETSKTSSIQIPSENVCTKDQKDQRHLHEVEERKLLSNDQMVSQCDDQMKQFSSCLNRLTQDNFETVLVEINQLEIEDDKFDECVKLLYEKAVIQKEFTEIFARLAAHLTLIKVESKMSFGTILLQRCREDFQKHVNSMDDWSETVDAQASLKNVNFIGELFKVKMISEDEIFGCIDKLFSKSQDEDSIECICELLSTAGNFLEGSESKLEECFSKVDNLVAKRCSSRIRLMVMDLINLRQASWSKI